MPADVAVTGAQGRLGRALVAAFGSRAIGWTRHDLDLDDPAAIGGLLDAATPAWVVHAAAWTDVDGCARDPELALRRNGTAVGVVARACADRGISFVLVSTNEVFDGLRRDGRGYGPDDATAPINAYGTSKLAGERAATDAFARGRARLAIVRTAWLFGPPGADFPAKILAAADRARLAGEPLRVVADERGNPTYTNDLAQGICALVEAGGPTAIHHVTNAGSASRAEWAREILRLAGGPMPALVDVPASTWTRASTPPLAAVLAPTPLPGIELRTWQAATAAYVPHLAVGAAGSPS